MLKRIILSIALISSYSFAISTDVNVESFISDNIGKEVSVPTPSVAVQTKQSVVEKNQKLANVKKQEQTWIQKAQENAKNINKIAQSLKLPISMNVKPVQENVGSVSWSLVNDKCEFTPEIKAQMFKDAWFKYLEYSKEQLQKMLDKDYWRIVAINKSIEAACNKITNFICVGAQKWMDYVPQEEFKTEYKDCVNKALDGTIKTKIETFAGRVCFGAGFPGGSGTTVPVCAGYQPGNPSVYYIPPCHFCGIYVGRPFVFPASYVKSGTTIDTNKIAAGISLCYPKMYNRFASEGITRCSDHYYKKCLQIFNSSLKMRMNFFGLEVKKAQKKCILNEENAKITFKTLINDYFDIKTEGEIKTSNGEQQTVKTIVKKAVTTDINSVYNARNVAISDANSVFDKFDKINVKSLSPIQNQILRNQFKLSFRNWVNYVFNLPGKVVQVSKGPYQNIKLLTGRWDFGQILGHNKKWWLGNDNWNTPIYLECSEIISETPDDFDNDKNAEILQENPIFVKKPTDFNGRFSYFLKLDPNLYTGALKNKIDVGMQPENNPYINTYLNLQKQICTEWAENLKTNLDNEWFKARNKLVVQMQQASKLQRKEYKSLLNVEEKEWLEKRKLLQDLINKKIQFDITNKYQEKMNNITYH